MPAPQHLRLALPALCAAAALALLSGCGEASRLPETGVAGSAPQLPAPSTSLIPTVKVAPVEGWAADAAPKPAPGMTVTAFARGLSHPRWITVLPNGDVLVAESNKPANAGEGKPPSLRGWVQGLFMKRAGAGVPSADRITLLRDADGDGVAEVRSVLLQGLTSPFGMALVGQTLFIANADAVVKLPYQVGQTQVTAQPTKLVDLPAKINHHWTKNLIASADGKKLYVTVGSNSNIGENGLENEEGRAAIWEVDAETGQHRVYASGLRNPNGMAWEPGSGKLWTVVNERDELGNDLVPDYLTAVEEGAFYGWPWSYFGQHVDERVTPARPEMVAKARVPDYALGAHVAPLGLAMGDSKVLGGKFGTGAFIGNHGSWNRKPPSGYKVVFVSFVDGKPQGLPRDVLTGFLTEDGKALGRPVGVALDQRGGLLVADDVGNAVWRVGAPGG
ncbi:PQQ-dependent sugar dehydrogenase [Pseudorhodoferax soli]|uniref:Glucose/arabinose dehydrogenase n=1 Tax=Pseudorhodoferax soli TaxID=545864 RepID=A0A368XCM3_9BURK|nr:sorbosone dehydrogenase family protein [Pseudorhodoferax soli]RCW63784.1 glucose/arabinose dehydrogenase [Pseudorhodoferax soli]